MGRESDWDGRASADWREANSTDKALADLSLEEIDDVVGGLEGNSSREGVMATAAESEAPPTLETPEENPAGLAEDKAKADEDAAAKSDEE